MADMKMDGCEGEGQRRSVSARLRESDSSERSCTYPLSDGSSTASPQTQGIITTYEKGNPSRKRNPSQESEVEETHVETKKPRILMLFGVSILIPDDEADDHGSTNITHVHQNPSRNPNPHQEEEAHALIQQGFHPRIFEGIEQHPVSLFEKELHCSDVLPSHNRLLITGNDKLMTALTEEERRKVLENNKTDYLRVVTTDANGVEYTLHLKKWPGSGAIVLKREWSKFVAANKLQKGDSVEGWGYRVGAEFRLALSIVRKSK